MVSPTIGPSIDFSQIRVGAIPPDERPPTVDYHSIVAAAVAALPDNTAEARRAVYDHALQVVHERLSRIRPPVSSFALAREELTLERVIKKIEAAYSRDNQQSAEPEAPPGDPVEPTHDRPALREVMPAPRVAAPRRPPPVTHVHGVAFRMFGIVGTIVAGLLGYWAVAGKPHLSGARSVTRSLTRLVGVTPAPAPVQSPAAAASGPAAAPTVNQTADAAASLEPAPSAAAADAVVPGHPVPGELAAASSDGSDWLSACRQSPSAADFAACLESGSTEPARSETMERGLPFWAATVGPSAEPIGQSGPAATPSSTPGSALPETRTGSSSVPANDRYRRGLADMKAGDLDRAVADLTEAIRFDPMFADAYVQRGQAHFQNGDADRAIVDFTQAISLDVHHAAAYKARGMTKLYKGDESGAIVDLTRAIQNTDVDRTRLPAIDLFYAHRSRAALYDRRQLYESELVDFNAMIDAYWKNPDLAAQIKANYRAQGAASLIAGIYRQRASVHLKRGNVDAAIGDLSVAIQIDPQRALAFTLERARVEEAAGRRDRAAADFKTALELNPNNEDAKAGLARLSD